MRLIMFYYVFNMFEFFFCFLYIMAFKRVKGGVMVKGKKYAMLKGSRAQVMNGTAYSTGYGGQGLKKKDLIMVRGRIKSRKARSKAKKNKNLGSYVDMAKKNKGKTFKLMKKGMAKRRTMKSKKSRRSRRRR